MTRILTTLYAVLSLASFVGAQALAPTTRPVDPTPVVNALRQFADSANSAVATATQQAAAAQQAANQAQAALSAAQRQIATDQQTIVALQAQLVAATQPAAPAPDAWPNRPALPPLVTWVPIRTYCVASAGNDSTADGSTAHPFATAQAALNQAGKDQSAGKLQASDLVCIAYHGGDTFTQALGVNRDHVLFTSYGDGLAYITGTSNPFYKLQGSDLCFDHLKIAPSADLVPNGIYTNGTAGVVIQRCSIKNYVDNVNHVGGTGLTVRYCFIGYAHGPILNADGSYNYGGQGLYTEGDSQLDIQGNVFWQNGWNLSIYTPDMVAAVIAGKGTPSQVNLKNATQFYHGIYHSTNNNSAPATDRFNIFGLSACTGIQGRPGGLSDWDLFYANGNASDGYQNGASGEISHCVVLGNLDHRFFYWGGGLLSQAATASIHDCLFASTSDLCQNAAVTIGDAGTKYPSYIAKVANIEGIWPHGLGTSVAPDRVGSTTILNVTVRAPKPGEVPPNLRDLLGVTTDDAVGAALEAGVLNQDPNCSTPVLINKIAAAVRAMR